MKSRSTLKRITLATAIATSILGIGHSASASEWTSTVISGTPTTAGWTSTTDPGWTTGGVPNAPGAVAEVVSTISGITGNFFETVQNTGAPVTLGTIRYGNGNAVGPYYWQITPTDGITLDSGGAGPAVIIANSTTAGGNNELYTNGGTLTLASNLEVINNTTTSTTGAGAIAIRSSIAETGGSRSVTYINNAPIPATFAAAGVPNSISISGESPISYTGGTTIAKGVVEFRVNQTSSTNTPFGSGPITLGTANSSDSAALLRYAASSASGSILTNNITLASNNTGSLTLGVIQTGGTATQSYDGTIDLNGHNLVLYSNSNTFGAVRFTGNITGTGNLTINGTAGSVVEFRTTAKTYVGDTILNTASLIVRNGNSIPDGPGKGNVVFTGTGVLHLGNPETINGLSGNSGAIRVTGVGSTAVLTVGNNDVTATYGGDVGRNTSSTAGGVALVKIGTGTQTLSGVNNSNASYTVNAGTLKFTRPASLFNSNTANWLDTKIFAAANATMAFNVGGTGFTSADLDILKVLGTATGGFMNNSILGLDTSVATAGDFTYASGLANTNAGSNVLNIRKMGANTLSLSGASTYTGATLVNAGILNFATQAAYYNNNAGGEWSDSTGAKLIVSPGATAGFTIGNAGEFTETDIATINANGSATGGFLAGSNLGLNPSVASYTYGTVLTDASGQSIGLVKFGANELVLNLANTYTGSTTVSSGTLTVGANVAAAANGPLGNSSSAILLGDANTSTSNTRLLTGGSFTVARGINVANTGGTSTIGSAVDVNSVFSGAITLGKNVEITSASAGANTLTVSGAISGTGFGVNKVGVGNATLSGTNTYTGNTTVTAGTLNVTGSHTTGANYSVASGANLITNNVRVTSTLTVDGTATINANGGTTGASKVETLTIGAGGKLNLKNNDIVVGTAVNIDAVRSAIKAGVAGAAGITSDLPAFGVTTGFGYALGNDAALSPLLAGNLTGQSYDADSVLVKYTFLGDADLDGDSDLNDLGLWAAAFTGDLGNPVTPVTFWTSGDFDYDGDTDLNDLGFWASTFTGDLGGGAGSLIVNAPGAPAGAVAALNSMGITVVPEPSTFVLAGIGLTGLALLRKRKVK